MDLPLSTPRCTSGDLAACDPAVTARRLYDAECCLHAAHQTHVDDWITAAADKLHAAVEVHLAAVADTSPAIPRRPRGKVRRGLAAGLVAVAFVFSAVVAAQPASAIAVCPGTMSQT